MKVRELRELLAWHDQELEVRIWDQGWGDHVPVSEVNAYTNYVIVENTVLAEDRERGDNDTV